MKGSRKNSLKGQSLTAYAVGLSPSIPHDGGLEVLQKHYNILTDKTVPTEDFIKTGFYA